MSGAVTCARMALLIQADHDGELGAADSVAVLAHLDACADCRRLRANLLTVSAMVRQDAFRHHASDRVRRTVVAMAPAAPERRRAMAGQGLGALVGAALAASIVLAVLPPRPGSVADETAVVDSHLRALQPGHLMDVVSTDRHTVKPWFDGRLDYAPPVRDFAAAGFPLKGARLDYLGQRPVAALVYGRDRHLIDVYVFPGGGPDGRAKRRGYNIVGWSQGGMMFWAISDLNAADLAHFRQLWAATD